MGTIVETDSGGFVIEVEDDVMANAEVNDRNKRAVELGIQTRYRIRKG